MNSVLFPILAALSCATVVGAVILVVAARRAPEGIEGEDGFQVLEPAAASRRSGQLPRGYEHAA